MTTDKTKAAWNALETIKHYSKCSERGQEAIQSEFDLAVETIAAYITAMPHGYDDGYTTNATSGTNTRPRTIYDMCEKCGYSYERGDQCSSCAAYKECDFGSYLSLKYPNGLRIVKEKK